METVGGGRRKERESGEVRKEVGGREGGGRREKEKIYAMIFEGCSLSKETDIVDKHTTLPNCTHIIKCIYDIYYVWVHKKHVHCMPEEIMDELSQHPTLLCTSTRLEYLHANLKAIDHVTTHM